MGQNIIKIYMKYRSKVVLKKLAGQKSHFTREMLAIPISQIAGAQGFPLSPVLFNLFVSDYP